jgi:DNA-binding response OmpR family regulator
MRKTARLDEILLSLGLVDEGQVRRALKRQEVEGGRFGTNLVALGSITERQLLTALAEQFGLPVAEPDERTLSPDLVRRMPEELLRRGSALPLAWNETQGVLTLAVTDPGDDTLIDAVKEAFGARAVRLRLAPDAAMAAVSRRLGDELNAAGDDGEGTSGARGAIELPELFDAPTAPQEEEAPAPESTAVLVTKRGSLRSFLPPLFERDGYRLIPVSDQEEAAEAFSLPGLEAVLVSLEMRETLSDWVRREAVPAPAAEVLAFASVSESLLANPLSYEMTAGSLRRSVEAVADLRSARFEAAIPYGLIASDATALGRRQGMRRVAVDGLHMAAHLLLPAPFEKTSNTIHWEQPFEDFSASLELANRIRFPWRLDTLLLATHAIFSGRLEEGEPRWGAETLLAARILAVAWYRHIFILRTAADDEEALIALRTTLREEMTPRVTSSVVEAYLELIAERGGVGMGADEGKILLVGAERIERVLAPALKRVGRDAFAAPTLAEAQTLVERRMPAALVIDGDEFSRDVAKFSRVTKLDGSALIFVLTDSSDPSRAMNLLEGGIDDVFTPPHDFDLISARVNRAVRARARVVGGDEVPAGQFSANFQVFSFLDLVQMLSQGLKTVRIELTREADQGAVLYMDHGRIVHAASGEITGPDAVYDVIQWEDEGEFTVREEDAGDFPEASIAVATDSLLMEGVRLLDESKR